MPAATLLLEASAVTPSMHAQINCLGVLGGMHILRQHSFSKFPKPMMNNIHKRKQLGIQFDLTLHHKMLKTDEGEGNSL